MEKGGSRSETAGGESRRFHTHIGERGEVGIQIPTHLDGGFRRGYGGGIGAQGVRGFGSAVTGILVEYGDGSILLIADSTAYRYT